MPDFTGSPDESGLKRKTTMIVALVPLHNDYDSLIRGSRAEAGFG